MKPAIQILKSVATKLSERARKRSEQECCGLLAGRGAIITLECPAANVAANPATSYEIAPEELFRLVREIRKAGLEMLAIYHSHPTGENVPSPRDIERAYYPGVAYCILSPLAGAPQPLRVFSIRDGCVTELEIRIV